MPTRLAAILLCGVIGISVIGLLVGLDDGVPRGDVAETSEDLQQERAVEDRAALSGPGDQPAVSYSEMRQTQAGLAGRSKARLKPTRTDDVFERCVNCHQPHSFVVAANRQEKLQSLLIRSQRRAFNGAPPVVPHTVEGTDDAACLVCHGQGARIDTLAANPMSHGPLAHCLQCHAAPPGRPFTDVRWTVVNSFQGLKAPAEGERAFAGAPPVIPHSTWMRQRCLSCHGGGVGWPGLEATHPWRTNCRQCHAVSVKLEQGVAF